MKGILRIARSSKGMTALMSIVGIVLINVLKVEPEMAKTLTGAIITLAGIYIVSSAAEDAAEKFRDGRKKD